MNGNVSLDCRTIRVLVVDHNDDDLDVILKALSQNGYDVLTASNGAEALRVLSDKGAQMVISQWRLPDTDGLDLCRAIRANETVGFVYFMILSTDGSPERLVEAFDAGVDDFLAKPFDARELVGRAKAGKRIVRLEAGLAQRTMQVHKQNARMTILNNQLEHLTVTDSLTGLANRRQTMSKLTDLWNAAKRYNIPLCCVTFDIDHFKRDNDTYGHAAGDVVIKQIAQIAMHVARAADIVGRVGGEEFLVLCPNTNARGGMAFAERLRNKVQTHEFSHEGKQFPVTVSLGVAELRADMACIDALVREADDALYVAKRAGRNLTRCTEYIDEGAPPVVEPAS